MKSGRPEASEFADYAAGDIAFVQGDDAVAALEQQGRDVVALFASFDDDTIAGRRYAPGKWTLKEILGHLFDDERIFVYRALCVARREPLALPGFDEKLYVASTDFESRPLAKLVDEYRSARAASITFFDSLTPDEWLRTGTVNAYTASVRGLAFHIAGHELHHLRIVRERYLPA